MQLQNLNTQIIQRHQQLVAAPKPGLQLPRRTRIRTALAIQSQKDGRQPWNFESVVRRLLGDSTINMDNDVTLVVGATGGVGKRTVEQLLKKGKKVRALVRNFEKAQKLLGELKPTQGAVLEVAAADITQKQTLAKEMFSGVDYVIDCSAVIVTPKEGDTVDRQKYYQGIKFFDPEVAGDTPEAVEYKGRLNLLEALKGRLGTSKGISLLDPKSSKDAVKQWGALDDVVMGGVSESGIRFTSSGGEDGKSGFVFSGVVSSENSGGFVSVRSKNFDPVLNLSSADGLEMRIKGNGQRFKVVIRDSEKWDTVGFTKSFDTTAGEWQTIKIPFEDCVPVFRAKTVKDGTKLNSSQIHSVQLMLSKFEYDGELNPSFKEGPFTLPIQYIRTYSGVPATPKYVLVSSAGVTRFNRPGIDVEQEPPAVRMNDMLGGILTYKLKAEDVIRESGIPYSIIRPCALTEEPAGATLEVDQGDVIKGKIGREEIASLGVYLLEDPSMVNVTFEIKSTVPFSTPFEVDPANPPAPRDWATFLKQANLKAGVTGKTIDGVYTGRQVESEAARDLISV